MRLDRWAFGIVFCIPSISFGANFDFARDAKPVLDRFCYRCHGDRKPRAGINLKKFVDGESLGRDPETWRKVLDALRDRTMPPEGKPAPSAEEYDRICEAIQTKLNALESVRDPGPSLIQRLTREQYNNTLRDLLGDESRPADSFPADGGGGAGFDNNASTLFVPPILMERYLEAAAASLGKADPARFVFARPVAGLSKREAARRSLEVFASKAFRRPVEPSEVDRLVRLFEIAERRGRSFEDALRTACRAALVSPNFLFLIERQRADLVGAYRVGEYELACRLSYFLWSSMPDRELFDLAARGKLGDAGVLKAQVERMLADPKSRALAKSFVGQWLRVSSLAQAAEPDRTLFHDYGPALREAMIEEPIVYFENLLRENRSLMELLESDYTFVNEPLARHYGIADIRGGEFRRVALKDADRGGVLSMASVLTLTSYPRRTSPVLRGKWVLEELLGTPTPPPPANVKTLPPDDRPKDGLSFRRRLERHRQDPNCASCHSKMDPLGFGLENFDPIGRKRTEIAGEAVDASGVLATGENFRGAGELKRILATKKKDLFLRNLVGRMLSYSLRRGLEYYDAAIVREIQAKVEADGDKSRTLILAIVESLPFQYRRDRPISGSMP